MGYQEIIWYQEFLSKTIWTQLYDIKYSYLIQIIQAIKWFQLIQFNNNDHLFVFNIVLRKDTSVQIFYIKNHYLEL